MLSFEYNVDMYKIFLGLNDKESHVQEISTENAMGFVSHYLANHFAGATVYNGIGVYKHENGDVVRENSLIVELVYVSEEEVEQAVSDLRYELNQESVMIVKLKSAVQFYEG